MVLIKMFSTVAAAIPKLIVRAPLLTAAAMIGASEVVVAAATYFTSSIPLEVTDVFTLLLGNTVSAIYYANSPRQLPQKILLTCTSAWALRLSAFLAKRTLNGFHDDRLDNMRNSLPAALAWSAAQTLWIFCTLFPVWITMAPSANAAQAHSLHPVDYVSLVGFCTGFFFESTADAQKAAFIASKKDPQQTTEEPFCNKGLFKLCRFPNYFGEFLMWSSLSVFAFTKSISRTRFLLPLGPAFIYTIFHNTSIPMAVSKMKKRLNDKHYKRWSQTPLFFPRIPKP